MIFSWFAGHLAVGGLFTLLFVPPDDFDRGFHRLTGFMASALLVVALAGGSLRGASGWGLVLASLAWMGVTQWGRVKWFRPTLAVLVALGIVALVDGRVFSPRFPVLETAPMTVSANSLAAAALLGSVAMAMLLGHWYLNIPGLDIKYLQRLTHLLASCLILRVFILVLTISIATPLAGGGDVSAWKVVGAGEAFFFWQRVGIGLLAPAVLTLLVHRTVKIRSTQSATGLLYVAVVFVLIGELISRFLYVAKGIPS